ncbi:MAG: O-antigen ligase family protein [Candidatus Latescibacterota bacterium]
MSDTPLEQGAPVAGRWPSAERMASWLRVLEQVGFPALVVAGTLLYAPSFSDYAVPKLGAVQFLVPLLLAAWMGRMALLRHVQVRPDRLYLPAAVFLGVGLVSLAVTVNPVQGAQAWLLQAWFVLLYVVGVHRLGQRAAAAALVWTVVGVGFVVTGLGLLQQVGVHLIPLPKAYGDFPVSTLGNPNFVAHYLDLLIPLTAGLLVVRRDPRERGVLALLLLFACAHMLLTGTRGGWVAVASGLLLFYLWVRRPGRWRSALVLVVVVGALLSPAAGLVLGSIRVGEATLYDQLSRLGERTVERALSVFERSDFSISQRRVVWSDTVDLIAEHPWLGVGYGNYELALPAHRSIGRHREWQALMGTRTEVAYHAHNEYLEVLAETGPVGLAAFLWLLGALLWSGYRRLREAAERAERLFVAGCLGGLAAVLVHAVFSFPLQDPASAIHFYLLGALMVAYGGGTAGTEAHSRWLVDRSLGRWAAAALGTAAVALVAVGTWMGTCLVLGDYHYFDGQWKLEIAQPNRAVLAFEEAVAWRGHEFRYYHMLGLANLEAGRPAQAEQALRRSLELHPHNTGALRLLGRALLRRGRGAEAVPHLRHAAELAPLRSDTYEWLALSLRQEGRHAEAVEAWKQAVAFAPEDAGLLNSLAVEYVQAGELQSALGVLEQAVRLHPQDAQIQGNLGSVYLALGRQAGAEEALLRAAELDPARAEWRLQLARSYLQRGDAGSARQQLAAVLQREPHNAMARTLLRNVGEERR